MQIASRSIEIKEANRGAGLVELAGMIRGEGERIRRYEPAGSPPSCGCKRRRSKSTLRMAEVTLAGTVEPLESRHRAENVAGTMAGVVSVMNNVRVRQPGGTGATG